MVTTLCDRHCLPHAALEFEITESAVVKNIEKARATMLHLKHHGVTFAIDDFGTGYSSLAHLRTLPFSRLKIDKSFIRNLPTSTTDKTIVKTCISLAHDLGMDVVAEGIETAEELEYVSQWGCDVIQGFLFSKPLDAESIHLLLSQQKPSQPYVEAA